ncbi:MAG: hypothetical protein AAF609_00605 [Cyanobacteria bacterium P01_C01_bin.120]
MDRRAYAETAGLTSDRAWLRSAIAFHIDQVAASCCSSDSLDTSATAC